MQYDNRIVAFIDVLRFQEIIDGTIDKNKNDVEEQIDFVYEAYEVIRSVWNPDETEGEKQVSIFSDTIVVSADIKGQSQVFWTLLEIKHLIMRMIWRGILLRGAVVSGKLLHTNKFVFGPALIEAYNLESRAAQYPRVILDREVIQLAGKARADHHSARDEKDYVRSLLEQDSDGMYYVDYFYKAHGELNDPDLDFPQYIEALGDIIRKGLMGSSHHGRAHVRVKYSWMRERYNNMVEKVTQPEALSHLEDTMPHLFAFYSQLKPISPSKG
ncbi:MAG: hypothetical protein ACTS1X_01720 [Parasphingopyxis sp.]|uniref:hypothetical protein n=1 Tax=Parasphingopyxis sp. TaxID=1920299 RepID=UPI003FA173A7